MLVATTETNEDVNLQHDLDLDDGIQPEDIAVIDNLCCAQQQGGYALLFSFFTPKKCACACAVCVCLCRGPLSTAGVPGLHAPIRVAAYGWLRAIPGPVDSVPPPASREWTDGV